MGTRLDNATGLYMVGIRDGKPRQAVRDYTGARYTQHSTGVADGQEGFVAFFEDFIQRNPKRDIRIVRGFEDGQYVFVQAYQSLNDGEFEYVTTDFFDSDADGRIIEHWDVISEFAGPNPFGRTQIDGATEIVDLHKTEENKALVRAMISDCLMPGGRGEHIEEFISGETYIQHNKDAPDGLERFAELVRAENRPLNYLEVVLCVGSGNFVATLSRAEWQGAPYAQVDLFRIEGGLIVEHWDNVEPVPEDTGNSGKF